MFFFTDNSYPAIFAVCNFITSPNSLSDKETRSEQDDNIARVRKEEWKEIALCCLCSAFNFLKKFGVTDLR